MCVKINPEIVKKIVLEKGQIIDSLNCGCVYSGSNERKNQDHKRCVKSKANFYPLPVNYTNRVTTFIPHRDFDKSDSETDYNRIAS